jgi:hypothetical protein
MRKPEYLSPSQLGTWEKNREEYYLSHLADIKAPRIPQTNYMSIGSAFDAYVKSSMHEELFGKGADPQFELTTLFEEQVEEHNRDWALENGKYVFDSYRVSGAYDVVMALLKGAKEDPQFESKIQAPVNGVPLLGKPDLRFIHSGGTHVILDWKVNGFCSRSAVSPAKNYCVCNDGWPLGTQKATPGAGQPHKDFRAVSFKGIDIHAGFLEDASRDWADQLSIYGWILGEPVGDENVVYCIDQLCAKPKPGLPRPLIRVANHRCRISSQYQHFLMLRLTKMWTSIQEGYIFEELSREENDSRCTVLNQQALSNHLLGDEILSMTRKERFF